MRSKSSGLVNGNISYKLTERLHLNIDMFNLFDAGVTDIDYFYASRLPGEPAEGVEDIHTHPVEPRSFRIGISTNF